MALPKGRAKKLLPKFIWPYKVIEMHTAALTVTLELPPELTARWVHPTFHMSPLRAHVPNDDARFPRRDTKAYYSFRTANEPEWFIDKILAHRWVDPMSLKLQVHWTLGDMTWEPLAPCKELAALDKYLDLCGVKRPRDLPTRCSSHMRLMPHMIITPSGMGILLYSFKIFEAAIELEVHCEPLPYPPSPHTHGKLHEHH